MQLRPSQNFVTWCNSSEDLIEYTSSDKMAISNANETSNNDINWWDMACPINCLKYKSVNLISSEETKFTCSECYTEQNIVRFCCTDDISNRFALERQQLHVLCKTVSISDGQITML